MSLHSPTPGNPGFPFGRRSHEESLVYNVPPVISEGKEDLARATKDLMMGVEEHTWPTTHPQPIPHHVLPPHFINHATYLPQFQQVQPPATQHYPQPQYLEPGPSELPVSSQSNPKRSSPQASELPRKKSRVSPPLLSGSSGQCAGPSGSSSELTQTKTTPGTSKIPIALLTPSQKKANHIQSEQKRRANIRRGYETLCTVVPALREAIERGSDLSDDDDEQDKGRGKSRPRRRKGEGGKDTRAGPKSEGIVLGKTIDYVNALLTERDGLLQRLEYATVQLPSTMPRNPNPIWEKPWTGGTGMDPSATDGGEEDDFEDS